jgi:class 3 adenylate cyclase
LAHGLLGPSAELFAATYPERVSALFLVNTSSRILEDADYQFGMRREFLERIVETLPEWWGTAALTQQAMSPSRATDHDYLERCAAMQRATATPKTAQRQLREIIFGDIRQALPAIQAPTVVFHRREPGVPYLPFQMGEFLAQNIPDATLVPLEGGDHWLSPDQDDTAYEMIEKVLTGELKPRRSERVFATVVVEDIVGSTDRAAQLGDERWKQVLDHHDEIAARTVVPEGRVVDTTGDGVVAVFDSPSRALRCMQLMRDEMRSLDLEIRVGVHAGEIERRGPGIAGIGVHIAARVCALANPAEVLVSRTVVDLVVGSNARFSDRGEHALKGVPGSWRLFTVVD